MRTEREIRVELQSIKNGIVCLKRAIKERGGNMELNILRLRKAESSRDLLMWVLGEL